MKTRFPKAVLTIGLGAAALIGLGAGTAAADQGATTARHRAVAPQAPPPPGDNGIPKIDLDALGDLFKQIPGLGDTLSSKLPALNLALIKRFAALGACIDKEVKIFEQQLKELFPTK